VLGASRAMLFSSPEATHRLGELDTWELSHRVVMIYNLFMHLLEKLTVS
jgi:hypothetical protein